MRQLILILFTSLLLCAAAQEPAKSDLAAVAKSFNDKCPMPYQEGMTLTKVYVDDSGNIVFAYDISDELYASIAGLSGILRDSMIADLSTASDTDDRRLVAVCVSDNANIVRLFSDGAGNTFLITITPADLRQ